MISENWNYSMNAAPNSTFASINGPQFQPSREPAERAGVASLIVACCGGRVVGAGARKVGMPA